MVKLDLGNQLVCYMCLYIDILFLCARIHDVVMLIYVEICQYLHESGWTKGNRMICCTQPRRVGVVSLAQRVSKEMGTKCGQTVGYVIRFDQNVSENTKIKFITDGILLNEIMVDPLLKQYSVIILDETHERSIIIDILLGLIKKVLLIREDLKLIVSSATLDSIKFKEYFKDISVSLYVKGRSYPVDVYYLEEPTNNYVKTSVTTAIDIHTNQKKGDILVFLTGEQEIDEACELCREYIDRLDNKYRNVSVLPMYSNLPFPTQLNVFKRAKHGIRKIIFSTNICETSVTIDGIVYVIDSGFVKISSFNPITNINSLSVVKISKSIADQRKGRAGRVTHGKCFRLYSEDIYTKMDSDISPEIKRTDLTECILKLKSLGVDNILLFDFITKPNVSSLTYSLELLYSLGAIDDNCKLTDDVGVVLSQLPIDCKMAKMLIESNKMGCSHEILSIISMLQIKNIFRRPKTKLKMKELDDIKLKFSVIEGDFIMYLNIFNSFILNNKRQSWCDEHMLLYNSLLKAVKVRKILKKYCQHYNIKLKSCENDVECILKCIVKGYFMNAAQLTTNGYMTLRGEQILQIHPSSILTNEAIPFILFNKIIQTDNIYVKDICNINPMWLKELAPHFYDYKTFIHDDNP